MVLQLKFYFKTLTLTSFSIPPTILRSSSNYGRSLECTAHAPHTLDNIANIATPPFKRDLTTVRKPHLVHVAKFALMIHAKRHPISNGQLQPPIYVHLVWRQRMTSNLCASERTCSFVQVFWLLTSTPNVWRQNQNKLAPPSLF